MEEEARKRFESILGLFQQAWHQFNERRSYEHKIILAIWIALVGGIASSFSLTSLASVPYGRPAIVIAAILLVVLQIMWLKGIRDTNHADQQIAFFYEKHLQGIADVKFDNELQKYLERFKKRRGLHRHWAHQFKIGMTILLSILLVIAYWSKFDAPHPEKLESQKIRRLELEVQKLQLELDQLRIKNQEIRLKLNPSGQESEEQLSPQRHSIGDK